MAGLSARATLIMSTPPIAGTTAITVDLITHDTRLAIAAAAIGAAAALVAVGLSLRADIRMTRIRESVTITRCALERSRFKAAMSSWIIWRFSPRHAAERRVAAASYQPLGLLAPAVEPTAPACDLVTPDRGLPPVESGQTKLAGSPPRSGAGVNGGRPEEGAGQPDGPRCSRPRRRAAAIRPPSPRP
jgi:hypothetical protein